MRDQRAVAIGFHAARFADKASVVVFEAEVLGHKGGDFSVAFVDLSIAPTVEIKVVDALNFAVLRETRASVARPEVFGRDIPKFNQFRGLRADRRVIVFVGQHHDRFEISDGIGDIGDCGLSVLQEASGGVDFAADGPLHEGAFVGVFLGGNPERGGGGGWCCAGGRGGCSDESASCHHGLTS